MPGGGGPSLEGNACATDTRRLTRHAGALPRRTTYHFSSASANSATFVVTQANFDRHSLCIAIIGSTREARQAGRRDAPIDTSASSKSAAEKLNTSSGLTSNKRLESKRLRNSAPMTPTNEPRVVSTALPRKTYDMTRPRVAPSAIRIPNSRVLCEVA